MNIRRALITDLPNLMEIYEYARKLMIASGNANQWINGYPSAELIASGINKGECYVCMNDENRIVGTFCFIIGDDPSYTHIEGAWLNEKPYATIHRLAASGEEKGVADACLHWCMKQNDNIRIDTHEENLIMQNILKKYDFIYCGIIYVANGTPRFAYQKQVVR